MALVVAEITPRAVGGGSATPKGQRKKKSIKTREPETPCPPPKLSSTMRFSFDALQPKHQSIWVMETTSHQSPKQSHSKTQPPKADEPISQPPSYLYKQRQSKSQGVIGSEGERSWGGWRSRSSERAERPWVGSARRLRLVVAGGFVRPSRKRGSVGSMEVAGFAAGLGSLGGWSLASSGGRIPEPALEPLTTPGEPSWREPRRATLLRRGSSGSGPDSYRRLRSLRRRVRLRGLAGRSGSVSEPAVERENRRRGRGGEKWNEIFYYFIILFILFIFKNKIINYFFSMSRVSLMVLKCLWRDPNHHPDQPPVQNGPKIILVLLIYGFIFSLFKFFTIFLVLSSRSLRSKLNVLLFIMS